VPVKPARGTISLNAHHQGTQVIIEIRDDGPTSISTTFANTLFTTVLNQLEDSTRLSDQDVINLIFEPGSAPPSEVTEVSGRGVGMDVVRTVLDRLKGMVHVTSSQDKGTTIQLRVPLTLASIRLAFSASVDASSPFRFPGRRNQSNSGSRNSQKSTSANVLRLRDPDPHARPPQPSSIAFTRSKTRIPQRRKEISFVVIGSAKNDLGLVVDQPGGGRRAVIKALPGEIVPATWSVALHPRRWDRRPDSQRSGNSFRLSVRFFGAIA